MRQIAAKQCRVKPLLHPFYYRFTTIDFSLQKHIVLELSRRVDPENTQSVTAVKFADGVERSGTESANFGG